MLSRLKTKKLHESASSIGHFLQILVKTTCTSDCKKIQRVVPSISMGAYAQNFARVACNSQKGNGSVQILKLLKFLHFKVLLVQWFTTLFLLSAARQILRQVLGSSLWVGIPFYPLFCLFWSCFFCSLWHQTVQQWQNQPRSIFLPFSNLLVGQVILLWVNKHILL